MVDGRAHCLGGGLSLLVPRPYAALERAVRQRLTGSPIEVAETVLAAIGDDVLVVEDLHWVHDSTLEVLALLVDQVPLLATSRPERFERFRRVFDVGEVVALGPLCADASARLADIRHPGLADDERRALLEAADGNPLLIERLVDADHAVSPSLQVAIAHRLTDLDDDTRRTIGELALLGRPAEPGLLSRPPVTSDLVEILPDGRLTLRHSAMATAISDSLDDDVKESFHVELADLLEEAGSDAEAAAHAYAAGDRVRAERLAVRASARCDDPGERAYLYQLAADSAADVAAAAEHRCLAAEDHVAAGRLLEALAQVDLVGDDVVAHAADATLQRARVAWFTGAVDEAREHFDRAEGFAVGDPDRTLRISNERALLEVRDHGPGYLERAMATAEAAAPHGGLAELRAQSTLGAALLYSGSLEWEPVLRSALAKIAAVGDPELESATAFHLVSGLGLHGRIRDAIEVAGIQVDRARVAGLGSWVTHLEQVWFTHRGVTSVGLRTMLDDADVHLATHQLRGARDHVLFGRLLAELDLGRFDDARLSLAQMVAESTGSPDATAMIATARAELSWFVDDLDMAAYALEEGRSSDGAYFGLQTLVERTVAHVFVRHGEPFAPRYPSFTMPAWWSAIHEIQGLVALAAGDTRTAADELRCAFEHFSAIGIPRWTARVGIVASDAGVDVRSAAIDAARRAGLVGVLQRLGISTRPELTFTEESVLRRIAAGDTSREAATVLGISPGTVDQHVESARRKLGAATRFEAAVLVT